MGRDKIETYLGFCIRSGRIEFGVDRAESLKKGVYLLMASASLSENSMKTLVKLKEKFSCPLLIAAVKDKNLASAILTAAEGDGIYKLYSGGNN